MQTKKQMRLEAEAACWEASQQAADLSPALWVFCLPFQQHRPKRNQSVFILKPSTVLCSFKEQWLSVGNKQMGS